MLKQNRRYFNVPLNGIASACYLSESVWVAILQIFYVSPSHLNHITIYTFRNLLWSSDTISLLMKFKYVAPPMFPWMKEGPLIWLSPVNPTHTFSDCRTSGRSHVKCIGEFLLAEYVRKIYTMCSNGHWDKNLFCHWLWLYSKTFPVYKPSNDSTLTFYRDVRDANRIL